MNEEEQKKANDAWMKTIHKMWDEIHLSNEKFHRNMAERLRMLREKRDEEKTRRDV
jgi:hypothetical protein